MDYKVITKEQVLNAKTYIPVLEKQRIVEFCADKCIDRLNISLDGIGDIFKMPAMYKENAFLKSRFLMGILAHEYLGIEIEPVEGTMWLLSADDYDRWAGGHIFNQIERMKSLGGEVRDKAFDLLNDFRDLEKKLNVEVYSLLQVQNDPCTRQFLMMTAQTSPETMKKAAEELKKLKGEFEEYKKSK